MAAVWEQNVIVTSSAKVADLNGNIFGRTICPLSFVVIALIFPELRSESAPPRPPRSHKTKQKNSLFWIGLVL